MRKQKMKLEKNGALSFLTRCEMENKENNGKFDYLKHLYLLFQNLTYGFVIGVAIIFVALVLGLLFIPEQTLEVIENIKQIF